jgi:hypothetical protein
MNDASSHTHGKEVCVDESSLGADVLFLITQIWIDLRMWMDMDGCGWVLMDVDGCG